MSTKNIDIPKTIGARLKAYRVARGHKMVDFATLAGVSQGSLSGLENDKSKPSSDTLAALVLNTDINLGWLLTGEGEMTVTAGGGSGSDMGDREAGPELDGDEYIKIPRYEVAASAGGGAVVHSEQVVDYLSFRADWVRYALGVSPQNLALISVIGDSMEPNLSEGDVVLLDMTTRSVLDGSIYALRLNGGLLIKRIQRKLDGSVVVKSDNPRYEQEVVSEEMAEQLRIVGRVIWVGRRL